MRFLRARGSLLLLMITFLVPATQARVVRVEITSRTDIQAAKPCGPAGAY